MTKKIISSDEAVKLVKNDDTVIMTGFVGTYPEELDLKLEQRFLECGATSEPYGAVCCRAGRWQEQIDEPFSA